MGPPQFSERGDCTRAWIPGAVDHLEPCGHAKAIIKQVATLNNWKNVRKGNSFRIFPFQHHRSSDRSFISFSINWWYTEHHLHSHLLHTLSVWLQCSKCRKIMEDLKILKYKTGDQCLNKNDMKAKVEQEAGVCVPWVEVERSTGTRFLHHTRWRGWGHEDTSYHWRIHE